MSSRFSKILLSVSIGLFFLYFNNASAQTVDVTRPTENIDTKIEILLNCSGTCKPGSRQVVLPKDSFVSLKTPLVITTPNVALLSSDTIETPLAQFTGDLATPPTTKQITYLYDPKPLYLWAEKTLPQYKSNSVEPELVIEQGRVATFIPPKDGSIVDIRNTVDALIAAYQDNQNRALAVTIVLHPNKKLSETNTLGINELLSRGESNFKGSPKNRRHNIDVGVAKIKGLIIKPGEEFSFNKNICPVDKEGGYLPELVIKGNEGTIPEYGGGLCQVSSTTYRSAMKAGLPITMRKNHSYAVQYYSPQGSDATTYCGGIDFRFKNDTAGSILIWPYLVDKDNLAFDFYGTKDDRTVTLTKPVVYDRKTDGSMKATWERSVTKDGITKHDEFKSVYLPPALFHKTEELDKKPPTPTPTPTPSVGTKPALEPGTSQ